MICFQNLHWQSVREKSSVFNKLQKRAKILSQQHINILFFFMQIILQQECQTDTKYARFKGHNSGVPGGICQVIELGRDIIPTNIFIKLNKDRMKTL